MADTEAQNVEPTQVAPPESAANPTPAKELYPMSIWKYDAFLWTMSVLVDLFFREVHPRGSWKVPRHGPILFVAAPHANQVCCPSHSSSYLFLSEIVVMTMSLTAYSICSSSTP